MGWDWNQICVFYFYISAINVQSTFQMECDYWSLGILAYEMVVGRTPFSGTQLTSTYFNILNHKKKLKYPEDVSVPESMQDLISKLLEDPSVRIKHDGLVKHSFFREIDWNNIRNGRFFYNGI